MSTIKPGLQGLGSHPMKDFVQCLLCIFYRSRDMADTFLLSYRKTGTAEVGAPTKFPYSEQTSINQSEKACYISEP